ncbi:MAG: GntR family transcriptional regulator [Lactobacillus sp.]|nr:GntR family transcriptional regulator [Lactobacillus sp.]
MSVRPKYSQIADQLIQLIVSEKQQLNTRFFTENELSKKYNVSRSTIRAALNELEDLKFITKAKNTGYYVSYEPAKFDFAKFYSFSKVAHKENLAPTSELLMFAKTTPNYYIAQKLGLKQDELVYRIERLRMLNFQPILFEKTFLPAKRFPKLRRNELLKNSLYDLLSTKYALKIKDGEEEFFASLINARESELLDLKVGAPCLKIQRRTFDVDHIPFEFTITTAPSRYFSYKVPLANNEV